MTAALDASVPASMSPVLPPVPSPVLSPVESTQETSSHSIEEEKSPRTNRPRMVDASRIRTLLENNKKSEAFKLLDRWESQWREIVEKKKNRVRKEPTEFNRFVQSKLPELRAKNPGAKPNDLMVQCAGLWKAHKAQTSASDSSDALKQS